MMLEEQRSLQKRVKVLENYNEIQQICIEDRMEHKNKKKKTNIY